VELNHNGTDEKDVRESPIGLGYRVPLIVASPWSRGGWVNSQIFDHTSTLQFLETFIQQKYKANIKESNITSWRRAVCGDLTSVFRTYNNESVQLPFIARNNFLESIRNAKNKKLPSDYKVLSKEEIQHVNQNPASASLMPTQEAGTRPSCALPYELYAEGRINKKDNTFTLVMKAENKALGKQSAGVAFNVYIPVKYKKTTDPAEDFHTRAYAVTAGNKVTDTFTLSDFENGNYDIQVYGPNGFYRAFKGNIEEPSIVSFCNYELHNNKLTGNIEIKIDNSSSSKPQTIQVTDNAYGKKTIQRHITAASFATIVLNTQKDNGWYDFSIKTNSNTAFERRCAGRTETGRHSITDPFMGRKVL